MADLLSTTAIAAPAPGSRHSKLVPFKTRLYGRYGDGKASDRLPIPPLTKTREEPNHDEDDVNNKADPAKGQDIPSDTISAGPAGPNDGVSNTYELEKQVQDMEAKLKLAQDDAEGLKRSLRDAQQAKEAQERACEASKAVLQRELDAVKLSAKGTDDLQEEIARLQTAQIDRERGFQAAKAALMAEVDSERRLRQADVDEYRAALQTERSRIMGQTESTRQEADNWKQKFETSRRDEDRLKNELGHLRVQFSRLQAAAGSNAGSAEVETALKQCREHGLRLSKQLLDTERKLNECLDSKLIRPGADRDGGMLSGGNGAGIVQGGPAQRELGQDSPNQGGLNGRDRPSDPLKGTDPVRGPPVSIPFRLDRAGASGGQSHFDRQWSQTQSGIWINDGYTIWNQKKPGLFPQTAEGYWFQDAKGGWVYVTQGNFFQDVTGTLTQVTQQYWTQSNRGGWVQSSKGWWYRTGQEGWIQTTEDELENVERGAKQGPFDRIDGGTDDLDKNAPHDPTGGLHGGTKQGGGLGSTGPERDTPLNRGSVNVGLGYGLLDPGTPYQGGTGLGDVRLDLSGRGRPSAGFPGLEGGSHGNSGSGLGRSTQSGFRQGDWSQRTWGQQGRGQSSFGPGTFRQGTSGQRGVDQDDSTQTGKTGPISCEELGREVQRLRERILALESFLQQDRVSIAEPLGPFDPATVRIGDGLGRNSVPIR